MSTYIRGQRVRFTEDNLGVMTNPYGGPKALLDGPCINAGDVGSYVEPSKVLGDEDWHIIAVHTRSRELTEYVPVHVSMIEPIEEDR